MEPSVSKAIVKNDFELLIREGISPVDLEEMTGLKRDRLQFSDERLPIWYSYRLMEAAANTVRTPAFALHMGENTDVKNLGIFGNIAMNCGTVRNGIDHIIRYYKIARGLTTVSGWEDGKYFFVTFDLKAPKKIKHHIVEKFFVSCTSLLRKLTETEFNPVEIQFEHPEPSYLSEYYRILCCPIHFNHHENVMCLDKKFLDIKYPSHNPDIHQILCSHAEDILNGYLKDHSLKNRVRHTIIDQLHEGTVSINMMSDQFQISRWTLNRRLSKEGTSFQDILSQTRKELALEHLKNSRFTNLEVASLLGFADPYSFPKAFRKWTGQSPLEYRKELAVT